MIYTRLSCLFQARQKRDMRLESGSFRDQISAPQVDGRLGHSNRCARSFPEQPENESEKNTEEQARHDGKIKAEVASRVVNIPRQPPQPDFAQSGPNQCSHRRDEKSGDNEEFAHFIHPGRKLTQHRGLFKTWINSAFGASPSLPHDLGLACCNACSRHRRLNRHFSFALRLAQGPHFCVYFFRSLTT